MTYLTELEERRIARMFQSGISCRRLRKMFHVCHSRLVKILQQQGIIVQEGMRCGGAEVETRLSEKVQRARELGLSYGQYEAMLWQRQHQTGEGV